MPWCVKIGLFWTLWWICSKFPSLVFENWSTSVLIIPPLSTNIFLKNCFHSFYSFSKQMWHTRDYQKVRRLMQWNQFLLSDAYKFCREYKTTNFYQMWKNKLNTLIINKFIIKYILYGMVTRPSLRWDPWRFTASLFFYVYSLYINTL